MTPDDRPLFRDASFLIGALPERLGPRPSLAAALDAQVRAVLEAHGAGRPSVAVLLRSYGVPGSDAEILGAELTLERARQLVADEHRFKSWDDAVARVGVAIDRRFEAGVDAIVEGDVGALEALLRADPELARARTAYAHQTTLLHHVGANGIEHTRQWQSPKTAPEIARALLRAGADPNATCGDWAGGCNGSGATTMELLVSSAHAAEAGVQGSIVEVLAAAGAKVDGIDDDGAPLWTAITFGYGDAVDALVRSGARLDNLVFAAAAGDVARVREMLGDGPRPPAPTARSAARIGSRGRKLDPAHELELALIYASALARRETVELLLTRGPDLSYRDPCWRSTALGVASYPHPAAGRPAGNPEIVALLRRAGA